MYSFLNDITPIFEWLLKSTLQVSVVIAIILAAKALLAKKLTPRWHYMLWLLVIVKMVMPVSLESSISIFNLMPGSANLLEARTSGQVSSREEESESSSQLVVGNLTNDNEPIDTGENKKAAHISETKPIEMVKDEIALAAEAERKVIPVVKSKPAIESPQSVTIENQPNEIPSIISQIDLAEILPYGWLGGAGLLGVYVLFCNIKLWRIIRVQRPVTDSKILNLLEDCKSQMNMHAYLAVVETDKVSTPALFGFLRPRLLLPKGMIHKLSREQLRHIFLHELAHLKRGDIYFGWITALLQTMHWFNPLVWYGFHNMRADRELACDELAISAMKAGENSEYGKTIVSLLEDFSAPQYTPGLAGILEEKSQLKRRISMIASNRKGSLRLSMVVVLLMAAIGLVSLTDAQQGVVEKNIITISENGVIVPAANNAVELANGVTVELLGVNELSVPEVCWKPDGALLDAPLPLHIQEKKYQAELGQKAYEFSVKLHNLPDACATKMKAAPNNNVFSVHSTPNGDQGTALTDHRFLWQTFDEEVAKCYLKVSVAVGKWKTVGTGQNKGIEGIKGIVTDDNVPGLVFLAPLAERRFNIVAPESKSTVRTVVSLSHNIMDKDVRVIAFDKAGQNHLHATLQGGAISRIFEDGITMNCQFDLAMKDIDRLELQVRPYRNVTFKGVALRPGVKPDSVKIMKFHIVQAGESLHSIAEKYYGDGKYCEKIYQVNKETIGNVDQLRLGMKLVIPELKSTKEGTEGTEVEEDKITLDDFVGEWELLKFKSGIIDGVHAMTMIVWPDNEVMLKADNYIDVLEYSVDNGILTVNDKDEVEAICKLQGGLIEMEVLDHPGVITILKKSDKVFARRVTPDIFIGKWSMVDCIYSGEAIDSLNLEIQPDNTLTANIILKNGDIRNEHSPYVISDAALYVKDGNSYVFKCYMSDNKLEAVIPGFSTIARLGRVKERGDELERIETFNSLDDYVGEWEFVKFKTGNIEEIQSCIISIFPDNEVLVESKYKDRGFSIDPGKYSFSKGILSINDANDDFVAKCILNNNTMKMLITELDTVMVLKKSNNIAKHPLASDFLGKWQMVEYRCVEEKRIEKLTLSILPDESTIITRTSVDGEKHVETEKYSVVSGALIIDLEDDDIVKCYLEDNRIKLLIPHMSTIAMLEKVGGQEGLMGAGGINSLNDFLGEWEMVEASGEDSRAIQSVRCIVMDDGIGTFSYKTNDTEGNTEFDYSFKDGKLIIQDDHNNAVCSFENDIIIFKDSSSDLTVKFKKLYQDKADEQVSVEDEKNNGIVYLAGKIARPGPYQLNNDKVTLKMMVASVGGLNGIDPDKAMARITRQKTDGSSEEIIVSLLKLFKSNSKDYPLQANDLITIYSGTDENIKPSDVFHTYKNKAVAVSVTDTNVFKLSNGAKVELVGFCKDPFKDTKWWKPDGSFMETPEYTKPKWGPPMRDIPIKYAFLIKISHAEDPSVKIKVYEGDGFSTSPAADGTALCYVKHVGTKTYREHAYEYGPVGIGVAKGRWLKARGVNSGLGHPRTYMYGSSEEIVIQPPQPEKSSPDMAAQFWQTATSGDYQLKLVCKLKDGSSAETHLPYHYSAGIIEDGGISSGKIKLRSFTIDVPVEKIVDYDLFYRQFEFVRFDNVAFKPGAVSVDPDIASVSSNKSIADIGDGEKLVLAGICEWPVTDKKWWSMDGTSLEKAVTDSWPGNDGNDAGEGEISRIFAFKVDGMNPNDVYLTCDTPNGYRNSHIPRYDDKDWTQKSEIQGYVIKFKDTEETTDITIGVGAGPWITTAGAGAPGMSGSTADNIFHRSVLLEKPTESNGQSRVEVKHLLDKEYVCRIIAHGKDGKIYYPIHCLNLDNDIRVCHARFDKKLDEIKGFSLQARLRRYVTFKDVALKENSHKEPGLVANVANGNMNLSKVLTAAENDKLFESFVSIGTACELFHDMLFVEKIDLNKEQDLKKITIMCKPILDIWPEMKKIAKDSDFEDVSISGAQLFDMFYKALESKNIELSKKHLVALRELGNQHSERFMKLMQQDVPKLKPVKQTKSVITSDKNIMPTAARSINEVLSLWVRGCATSDIKQIEKCLHTENQNLAERDAKEMKELLEMNKGWKYSLLSVVWNDNNAMAVSNSIKFGDPKVAESMIFVWTLKKTDSGWRIIDTDLEELEGLQIENSRFVKNHPDAKVWCDDPDYRVKDK